MKHGHAAKQRERRGIPPLIVHSLEQFGDETYDRNGGIIIHFSKAARRRLERYAGSQAVRKMDEWLDAYLVTSTDGTPITVGHRYRKLNR